jgi:hypothetical protein
VDPPWSNLFIGAAGIIAIVGSSFVLRHREAVLRFIISQNRSMYGNWVAEKMQKGATPMSGVGVPAIFGIVVGSVFILAAIFGQPRS